jgi:hypothetical protein
MREKSWQKIADFVKFSNTDFFNLDIVTRVREQG